VTPLRYTCSAETRLHDDHGHGDSPGMLVVVPNVNAQNNHAAAANNFEKLSTGEPGHERLTECGTARARAAKDDEPAAQVLRRTIYGRLVALVRVRLARAVGPAGPMRKMSCCRPGGASLLAPRRGSGLRRLVQTMVDQLWPLLVDDYAAEAVASGPRGKMRSGVRPSGMNRWARLTKRLCLPMIRRPSKRRHCSKN